VGWKRSRDRYRGSNGWRYARVGEAQFRQQPVGYEVFSQLENEAPPVGWTPDHGGDPEYRYALFSRSGFKGSVEEAAAERDDIRLFSVDDVVRTLSE